MCFVDDFANTKLFCAVPPIGKYESIDMERYKTRATKWLVKSDKTDGQRLKPFSKDNSPSPVSYNWVKSFENTQYEKNDKFTTVGKE